MKKLIFIVLGLLIISCNKKEEYYKKELIGGDWIFISEQPKLDTDEEDTIVRLVNMTPPNGYMNYAFLDDEIYEDKRGFYKYSNSDRRTYFLGNDSKYEIKDDSLRLYDLVDKNWNSYGIIDLKSDTLSLNTSSGYTIRFNRKRYNFKNKADFDKIIISSSGCYGTCPVSSILIDKSGEIIFEGLYYTTVIGLYKSKISKDKFDEIITSFQKADWINLNESYEANHTDDERIIVSFIKNNKIIRTVSDYGHEAPEEFIWAYQPLRYLYQQVKLEKLEEQVNDNNLNINLLREQRNYPYPKLK